MPSFRACAQLALTVLVAGASLLVPGRSAEAASAGTTSRVSVANDGVQSTGGSSSVPAISADGRYVAFTSTAWNLVADDTQSCTYTLPGQYCWSNQDVFVRDRRDGTTRRVSVASDGTQLQGGGTSSDPTISGDGRYVAFKSDARDLVPGDTNGVADVFVHDLQTRATTRVSIGPTGDQANGESYDPAISGDGRYVAFASVASNLVAGDTNDVPDMFVRDLQAGTIVRVNVASDGTQANSINTYSNGGREYTYGVMPSLSIDGFTVEARQTTPPPPPPPPPSSPGPSPGSPDPVLVPAGVQTGYWMITGAGEVHSFGDARHYGSEVASTIKRVDIEPAPNGNGYWILAESGAVYAKGAAQLHGSAFNALRPGEKAAALSSTPKGDGYWIFTDRGRVLTFGAAQHFGGMSGVALNGPVLDAVATPAGDDYWMVAADGGVFTFGKAKFSGSTGNLKLNKPVMSMAPDPDGAGYWLVASGGGIFAFDAPFYGSMGATPLNKPISGIVPGGGGYMMVGEDGGIFAFGNVRFHGSLGANPPSSPVVAVALLS